MICFICDLFCLSQETCTITLTHIYSSYLTSSKFFFVLFVGDIYCFLTTSSLIRHSYTVRATIFEKVFRSEKFPKTDYCSFCRAQTSGLQECNKFKSGEIKCHKEYSHTSPKQEWHNIPLQQVKIAHQELGCLIVSGQCRTLHVLVIFESLQNIQAIFNFFE